MAKHQKLPRDPYHKLNHHRKAGPMKDSDRKMSERDEIWEQSHDMNHSKVAEECCPIETVEDESDE